MEEDKYTMYAVKKICIWMIMAITILIAMKWTGSAWCLWAFCIPAISEYSSREAAAQDWNNLQPAHYCCNAAKSNKTLNEMQRSQEKPKMNVTDGEW